MDTSSTSSSATTTEPLHRFHVSLKPVYEYEMLSFKEMCNWPVAEDRDENPIYGTPKERFRHFKYLVQEITRELLVELEGCLPSRESIETVAIQGDEELAALYLLLFARTHELNAVKRWKMLVANIRDSVWTLGTKGVAVQDEVKEKFACAADVLDNDIAWVLQLTRHGEWSEDQEEKYRDSLEGFEHECCSLMYSSGLVWVGSPGLNVFDLLPMKTHALKEYPSLVEFAKAVSMPQAMQTPRVVASFFSFLKEFAEDRDEEAGVAEKLKTTAMEETKISGSGAVEDQKLSVEKTNAVAQDFNAILDAFVEDGQIPAGSVKKIEINPRLMSLSNIQDPYLTVVFESQDRACVERMIHQVAQDNNTSVESIKWPEGSFENKASLEEKKDEPSDC